MDQAPGRLVIPRSFGHCRATASRAVSPTDSPVLTARTRPKARPEERGITSSHQAWRSSLQKEADTHRCGYWHNWMVPDDLTRFPPAYVRKALRHEVGFGCPVPKCRSPFLEYHHFDPEWHVEHHHRQEGLIPLCAKHHAQADAFTVVQLRQFKKLAHDRPAHDTFQWLRHELVGVVGSGIYHETPILVAFKNQPLIWFNRDELGHALLNVRMLTRSGQPRLLIQDNDFVVRGAPTDFESPPSGHLLRVRYDNGDYLRVEFREFKSLEAACKKFEHIPQADIRGLVQNWPMTFVIIRMKVGGTGIQFSPNWTRWSAKGKGRVLVISHCQVGLVL